MKLLLLLSAILLLISCGKERHIHLTAKNAVTGAPYPGLNYYVVEEKEGNNGTDYTTVATGTLDGNGEKIVPVKIRKNRSYVIRLDPPPNWCYMNEVSYSYTIHGEKSPTFDFTFAECATLQRKVKNINCIDANDKIEIYIDNTVHSLLSTPWILNGCADYTTTPTQVPIGTYTLHWIVTKNNVSTDYYDSFNLTENEMKVYEIDY